VKISIENKVEIERFVLLMNIGLIEALKTGIITIEEAEKYLYSPYSVDKLERLGIREEVITLINLGCELEDVESIIPQKLIASMDEIEVKSKELLKLLPRPILSVKKWID
jgi:hypothetical protein